MSAGHELRLLGLVLSTIVLVLPTTTACLAADALSPGVHLMAQAAPQPRGSDRLVKGGLSLPETNRYERYDRSTGRYEPVDVASVPWRVERGEWIYDHTAGVWVTHPNGGRNPDYLARSQEPAAAPRGSADPRRPPTTARVDPAPAARLQRLMVPLIQVMDHSMPLDRVKVVITHDPQINAGNGGGQFFVTSGLLEKANDDRLRSVLAHELAHQDLNHVAKAQVLGLGLNIGAASSCCAAPAIRRR